MTLCPIHRTCPRSKLRGLFRGRIKGRSTQIMGSLGVMKRWQKDRRVDGQEEHHKEADGPETQRDHSAE
jgi:hypothetical protein